MTKTRPFLSMCYGDPSATEVPPCCETATKKLTFSTTSVLLLLNMPLSLSRATIFRRQKNPRRVYRPKIAGILFVYNEPEGKYYTVPCRSLGRINCVAPERVIQRRVACFGSFRLYLGGSQYHHHFSDVDHTFLCVLVFEILLWENHESSYLKF